jgi:hypothetical protein
MLHEIMRYQVLINTSNLCLQYPPLSKPKVTLTMAPVQVKKVSLSV